MQLAHQPGAVSKHERAHARRAAELVGGEREGVGEERLLVDGDLARGLHRVDVHPAAGLAHHRAGLRHRLDHPGLVVGQHQGDEGRAVGGVPARQAVLEPGEVGHAPGVDRQGFNFGAGGLGRLLHRLVLDGADDQALGAMGYGAVDRQGVGLGRAGHEDHAARRHRDEVSDRGPRRLDRAARGAARRVHRGRIAAQAQGAQHRRLGLGPDRRGRVVVEVGRPSV